MNDAYRQGFVDRCASQGVDPKQLAKSAAMSKVIKGVASAAHKATKTTDLSPILKRVQAAMKKRWDKMSPDERSKSLMQD